MKTSQNSWLYTLITAEDRRSVRARIAQLPLDGDWELVIRQITAQKTMKQLGALFGLWYGVLEDLTGYEKDELHQEHKMHFLVPIYLEDPKGVEQEIWSELYYLHRDSNDTRGAAKVAKRASLAWATKQQTSLYLSAIDRYYYGRDVYLPIPDRFNRVYKREVGV